MLVRALIVLLIALNVGVAAWWVARPAPSAPIEEKLPQGVARLQLIEEGRGATNTVAMPVPMPVADPAVAPAEGAAALKSDASVAATAPAEAAKIEAAKLEASKLEAAKLETAKLEAAKLEAAKLETAKFEAAKLEAAKLQASKLEAAKVEAAKAEAAKLDAAKLAAAKLAASKAEAAKAAASLVAQAKPQCFSVGPFADAAAAAAARAKLQPLAQKISTRSQGGASSGRGWRVYLPTASADAAQAAAQRIRAAGFNDLFVMSGAEANAIALGRFRSEESARKRGAELSAAGFAVRVESIGGETTGGVTWIDIATTTSNGDALRRAAGASRWRGLSCGAMG